MASTLLAALDLVDTLLARDPDFGARDEDQEIREKLDVLREKATTIERLRSVRYTPFLDKYQLVVTEDVPTHAVNIIDSCLSALESMTDWGEYEGKKRKPCPGQPILLAGMPIGMYHCEGCGMMVVAGMPHMEPGALPRECTCSADFLAVNDGHQTDCQMNYPIDDYEIEMGQPWPPGYEED